jgi:hypothetical protein
VAAYFHGKRSDINRNCASATGSACSCILKMLSVRKVVPTLTSNKR